MNSFLPKKDPLIKYISSANSLKRLENISNQLPKLLLTGKTQSLIDNLKPNDLSINKILKSNDIRELKLAMNHLSFISHSYIWGAESPQKVLPEVVAKPWVVVANKLGRPPILSYGSYCLDNWFRLNTKKNISLENVGLITNFLGGVDEDWFVTIHVCIENAAIKAINAADKLSKLNQDDSVQIFSYHLKNIILSLKEVNAIFRRMPEKCDPYIYYHRVRPYIFGWKNNPDLPKGIIYEGHYDNKPQMFRGETGAQSSIIPTFDALFAVNHERDELKDYLDEMRLYMPKKHRSFIEYIESNTEFDGEESSSKIVSIRDKCLDQMTIFRSQHLQYASDYIHKQNVKSTLFGSGGSVIRGTGGTPFMKYLRKHRDETDKSKRK